jgi:voltage-gated potassium channel
LADPNAFNAAGIDVSVVIHWINYSFGMLTTLGYAGIVANDSVGHTLCSAEAVTGQLYLAVLVARLVSMHVSAEEQSKQDRSAG